MGTSDSKPSVSTDAKKSTSKPSDQHDQVIDAQLALLETELQASQGGMQSTVQQQKLLLLEAELRMQRQLADLDEAAEKGDEDGQGEQIDGDDEDVVIEEHELAELEAELEALEMKEDEKKAGDGEKAS